jgi:hypothetical protein
MTTNLWIAFWSRGKLLASIDLNADTKALQAAALMTKLVALVDE